MQLGGRTAGGLVKISVTTGGSGYSSTPSITISGGGGAGASAVVHMAGTQVESVVVTSAGSGFSSSPTISFSGGGGTGAAASAYAYTGSLRPMCFFKGRYNDLYGVDGMGRGVQWDGAAASVQPAGLNKPATAPAVTAGTTNNSGRVTAVQLVRSGAGYHSAPAVTFAGSASQTASAQAVIANGRVTSIRVTEQGSGYTSTPDVQITGGIGDGATFTVGVTGRVDSIDITASGSGYTSAAGYAPVVLFHNTNGLVNVNAIASVAPDGRIDFVQVFAGGTGATASGVTASISAASGSGAALAVNMAYTVAAVTVASSGSGYHTAPIITFRPDQEDPIGNGAAATAFVNTTGNVTGVSVYQGGIYSQPPDALVLNTQARAQATLSQNLRGKYLCCVRYVDSSSQESGGQRASSISDLYEVDAGDAAQSLTWTVSHSGVDARVTAMELWRTTGDQSVILFRVATILRSSAQWSTAYTESLNDDSLKDTARDGYALMPITLPSGQLNARRFGVPPGEFAVGCMFQDRAWYAVDTSGARPNSLMFSEVDEPESVPAEYELVVQENTGVPDRIVALIPFASQLLIAQTAHTYALTYVAQPVIDASIRLVSYRGALNSRCWDVLGGVAYIADSMGVYAFDGSQEQAVSVAVDNYWREGIIDFSKSEQFHVRADQVTKTIRFFYCKSGDTETLRALCYCVATQAWWEELYATAVTATCPMVIGGRYLPIGATASGKFVKSSGASDLGSEIPYELRTGPLALVNENNSRSVGLLYKPTTVDANIDVRLHFNNSDSPRANAVASGRGDGFTTATGSTAAVLNMKKTRSALADAVGYARAYFSGRAEDRSAGADRHAAIAIGGTQPTSEQVTLYGLTIEGVK